MAEAVLDLHTRVTAQQPEPLDRLAHPPLLLCWGDDSLRLEAPVTIGANPSNQVVLHDRFVSNFHCRIYRHERGWRVKDLGSTNGTVVDGLRTAEAEVEHGARIRVGLQELRLEHELRGRLPPKLPGLLARDPALAPVLELLQRAAPSSLPVMLLGESGTGKELAARAVHDLSPRAGGPFVPLNCGAISHELAEAELFGHERGAFTGAVTSAPGAFGAADGGTLFLDEIGDLPPNLQVKLLRALESSEIKPVGAAKPRSIEVRVVCATHRNLALAVKSGHFREDLFYRLRGVTVELPPLRHRPRDVVPLAEHFLPPKTALAPDARAALLAHPWPGNVRELRHVVQLAALLSESRVIRAQALQLDGPRPPPPPPLRVCEPYASELPPAPVDPDGIDLRGKTLGELEELAIRSSWKRHAGNRRAVSIELGIARSSLLRKLDVLGLRE